MKLALTKTMRREVQKGFSLVTAIFLLVVLGGLGAVMVTFFSAQQQSSALDVMGARAYQAARAGIEWGAYQVLQNPSVGPTTGTCFPAGPSRVLAAGTLAGTLSGFEVNVLCSVFPDNEATVYHITANAKRGTAGQPDYVEREIQATIAR